MSRAQASPPRRLGLRHTRDSDGARPLDGPYAYSAGDRIAGDLTVIGHLAAGRLGHLYQVWSAREWCAFTCKILSPERTATIMAKTPMARFGTPDELIGAAILLCAPVAGSFITGAAYYVDGGFTAMRL